VLKAHLIANANSFEDRNLTNFMEAIANICSNQQGVEVVQQGLVDIFSVPLSFFATNPVENVGQADGQ